MSLTLSDLLVSAGSPTLLDASGGDAWSGIVNAFLTAIQGTIDTLFGVLGFLIRETIRPLLYFPPPTQFPAVVEMYWSVSFPLFWALLSVMGLNHILTMQLFPEDNDTDLNRFFQRILVAIVLIFLVGHYFDIPIRLVNAMGQYLFPEKFSVQVSLDSYEALAGAALSGGAVAAFAIFGSTKLLLTYGLFLAMLVIRMIVIYTMYALFPVLMGFWIVDVGIGKYTKMVSGIFLKLGVVLLIFGLLLSVILGVGGAVSGGDFGGSAASGNHQPAFEVDDRAQPDGDRTAAGVFAEESSGQAASSPAEGITVAWYRIYSWMATLWLGIALTSLLLSWGVSTGFFSKYMLGASMVTNFRSRMRRQMNRKEPMKRDPSSGNGVEGTPLTEKADNLTNGNVSDMSDRWRATKDSVGENNVGAAGLKTGNLAKRGAKAYNNILKTHGVPETIGETIRIGHNIRTGDDGASSGGSPRGESNAAQQEGTAGSSDSPHGASSHASTDVTGEEQSTNEESDSTSTDTDSPDEDQWGDSEQPTDDTQAGSDSRDQ